MPTVVRRPGIVVPLLPRPFSFADACPAGVKAAAEGVGLGWSH
jgi:hypothetical protein